MFVSDGCVCNVCVCVCVYSSTFAPLFVSHLLVAATFNIKFLLALDFQFHIYELIDAFKGTCLSLTVFIISYDVIDRKKSVHCFLDKRYPQLSPIIVNIAVREMSQFCK